MTRPNRDAEWLQNVLDAIGKVEWRTRGGRPLFDADDVLQDAIIRQVAIIGQAVKRLSEDVKRTYPDIPWREIAGMRDILVHDYNDVDLDIVWAVVEKDLPALKAVVQKALATEATTSPPPQPPRPPKS